MFLLAKNQLGFCSLLAKNLLGFLQLACKNQLGFVTSIKPIQFCSSLVKINLIFVPCTN